MRERVKNTKDTGHKRFSKSFDGIINGDVDDCHAGGPAGSAGIVSSVSNLANTILGAGLLGLPYALSKTGTIFGLLLFAICGFFSAAGLHLLTSCARDMPGCTFYKLSMKTVPAAKVLPDVAVAIKCFGVGTAYLLVIGNLMPQVVDFFSHDLYGGMWEDYRLWIFIFLVLFVVPTVVRRRIDSLRFTSYLAIFCFAFITIVVLIYATGAFDPCYNFDPEMHECTEVCQGESSLGPSGVLKFMEVIPIFIFGFTCHQNAFAITNELRNNTQKRLDKVIGISIGSAMVVYLLVSLSGYYTFGDAVESDILISYPFTALTSVVRIALCVALAFSYPLQCHPCRNSLAIIIYQKPASTLSKTKFYILTAAIVVGSFAISMFIRDLGIVLSIIGATGSTIISYILPGLYYYKMKPATDPRRRFAFFLFCAGCVIIPFSLTMIIIKTALEGSC